jgi:DNA-binding HxlR family transcriptional regulator
MQNKLGKIYESKNCPVRQVLDRIGDKWSTLIILQLGENEVMRFNELSQAIGDISQKMLTTTVRNLEADGLLSRKMYAEIPPKVEYRLTALGASLLPLIRDMVIWADNNLQSIRRNRTRYTTKSATLNRTRHTTKSASPTA